MGVTSIISTAAQTLGRKGGLRRGKRLSPQRRSEIARLGARAREESLRLGKAMKANFEYLAAVKELGSYKPIKSVSTCDGRLPGIYG
ncbi:MAG: hypothetical protein A2289_21575 [Deltaproteobacteria bacterium RIFOXYA12_FULL_58_15]|nr:MAG: hypothetical protein A2289_21575 [Deltaproteobacteria bacterium RIFOXYA12_FULL_58_15]OGR15003.1 MAG: hypothetical protein A2341_17835 [Deltaproteobacteria bacterium RIFOXYB12_FULL_58_9]